MTERRDAKQRASGSQLRDQDQADIDWLTVPLSRIRRRLLGGGAGPQQAGSPPPAAPPADEAQPADPANRAVPAPQPSVQTDASSLSDQRYFALAGLLVLILAGNVAKMRWPGAVDVWEHAAAARELASHPLAPNHPLYPVDAPHQFFNPYLLTVGLLSRFTRLSVVTWLNVAAIANLVMFLVGLRLFVNRVVKRKHADFYALLFVLFLWGPGAWFFSGFLHFDVIGLILAYPSTFSKGVVLLALWAFLRYLEEDDQRWLSFVFVACVLVTLTHPVDQVFLGVGLAALAFTRPQGERDRQVVVAVLLVVVSFLVSLLWPYFSFWGLLFDDAVEPFRQAGAGGDREMYVHVLPRMALTLLAVPFILRRLPNWRTDPLVVMLVGSVAVYWYGFLSEQWMLGRIISSIQFVAAVILAEERAAALEAAEELGDKANPLARWVQVATAAVLVAGVFYLRNGFVVLPRSWTDDIDYKWLHSYVDLVKTSDFEFLEKNHEKYPVVMSDLYTSLMFPVFGPKTVAVARSQAFYQGPDRGPDVNRFFEDVVPDAERRRILDKYGVSLLVVNVTDLTNNPTKFQPIVRLGREVSRNNRFVFVEVGPTR